MESFRDESSMEFVDFIHTGKFNIKFEKKSSEKIPLRLLIWHDQTRMLQVEIRNTSISGVIN